MVEDDNFSLDDVEYYEFTEEQDEILTLYEFYLESLISLTENQEVIKHYSHSEILEKQNYCAVQILKTYLDFLYSMNTEVDFSVFNGDDSKTSSSELWYCPEPIVTAFASPIYFVVKLIYGVKTFSIILSGKEIYSSNLNGYPFAILFEEVSKWFDSDDKKVWAIFNKLNKDFFLN